MAGTTTKDRDVLGRSGMLRRIAATVNKLVDDDETIRGAASASVVAVTELIADHATFKSAADAVETLTEELGADHPTFKAAVDKHKRVIINMPLSVATVAIGTTVQKVKTTATFNYLCNGIFKSLAATDDFWTLSGTTITDGNTNKYLLCVDAAGAASIVEGTQAATAGAVVLPAWPANKTVAGILQVATAGATFVPGTTALNAGTVTDTYYDGFDPALIDDGPATLSASIAIPSAPATLAAAVPSATAINAAGDLLAAKVGDMSGDAITA